MMPAAGGAELRPSPSPDAKPPRALVIDDDAAIRDLLCEVLGFLGFQVDAVASGVAGLALFEQRAYDLVVTDLNMPGLTGWDVVGAVRRRAPAPGLIMATGSPSDLDTERARAQAVTLLRKPFRLEELRSAVEEARRARTSEEEARVIEEVPVAGLGNLRTAIGALRNVIAQLEAVLEAAEGLIRERDGLRAHSSALEREHQALREAREALILEGQSTVGALTKLQSTHEATVRALGELRERYQALLEQQQRTADEVHAIARRLRPG